MQVRRVAVVATGALATAAAMGSTPAFAAGSEGGPELAPSIVGVLAGEEAQRASDEAMRELAEQWLTVAPEQAWPAPWEQEPPQILSAGSGSAASVGALQQCGGSGPWLAGLTAPIASPATVLGDCRNGNIDIAGDGGDALISILDNTAVSALAFQQCGSNAAGVLAGNIPLASPATVTGNCDNGNITIGEPEDGDDEYGNGSNGNGSNGNGYTNGYGDDDGAYPYHESEPAGGEPEQLGTSAPWEQEPPQILSAGSGSAVSGGALQQCGGSGPWLAGATAPIASPATVLGDCRNGNIDIHGDGSDALFSFLDNSALSVATFQQCGSNAAGVLAANVAVASPATVTGNCDNGNITVGH